MLEKSWCIVSAYTSRLKVFVCLTLVCLFAHASLAAPLAINATQPLAYDAATQKRAFQLLAEKTPKELGDFFFEPLQEKSPVELCAWGVAFVNCPKLQDSLDATFGSIEREGGDFKLGSDALNGFANIVQARLDAMRQAQGRLLEYHNVSLGNPNLKIEALGAGSHAVNAVLWEDACRQFHEIYLNLRQFILGNLYRGEKIVTATDPIWKPTFTGAQVLEKFGREHILLMKSSGCEPAEGAEGVPDSVAKLLGTESIAAFFGWHLPKGKPLALEEEFEFESLVPGPHHPDRNKGKVDHHSWGGEYVLGAHTESDYVVAHKLLLSVCEQVKVGDKTVVAQLLYSQTVLATPEPTFGILPMTQWYLLHPNYPDYILMSTMTMALQVFADHVMYFLYEGPQDCVC